MAVTFTNKASLEMKERVQHIIQELQAENTNSLDIHGSSFEIRFTKSIKWYVKTYAPKISALGGVILPILQASMFA